MFQILKLKFGFVKSSKVLACVNDHLEGKNHFVGINMLE